MRENRKRIILSCLAAFLPAIAGLLLWNRLPESMLVHFNAAGEADGWAGKPFAVLGIPAILTAVHFIFLKKEYSTVNCGILIS